uniref:EB domain-containing protein n=1 Tax=Heterorhabditis bacteriophora TaxID=37862 RepID=A0A1I7WN28_HETBA
MSLYWSRVCYLIYILLVTPLVIAQYTPCDVPAKIGAACNTKCREPLFCRNGECQCVQRGTTRISNGECVTNSRVGDRCSRHYDCTAPFSACLNSQCVCISGTIQQGQCQCLTGFHPTVDTLTHPMKNPSQTCSRDCESEALSRDTSCMRSGSLGSQCFIQKQCPSNSGCYRGRCMCRCGYQLKGEKCVALPPPATTTAQPNIPIIPGVSVNKGNDLFKLFGQIFGGGGTNGGIGSFING